MKAFQVDSFAQSPVMRQIALAALAPGQVQVRIAACGLNFADLLMIEGKYQVRPTPPVTLGMELAGRVEALGKGVTGLRIGARVAVFGSGGGLAEAGCFDQSHCVELPADMPFDHAAAFQIAYSTSHIALDRRARLQPGETLLVLGAAGGVGLTAVEIGEQMGARVIACARGTAKLDIAGAAGADHLIDSGSKDLTDRLRALGRVDVVYDPVGGDGFRAALRACRPEARLLAIGFASGDVPQIPANHLLVENLDVIGLNWGAYMEFAPEAIAQSLTTLLGWYAQGRLRPHISHRLPLDRAAEALDLLATRKSTGKVIVTMPSFDAS